MKHIIAEFMILLLLLCGRAAPSMCENLEGIIINNQRMEGEVSACFLSGCDNERSELILVDCLVPQTNYEREVLVIENRFFSKTDMQNALRMVGQKDQGRFINNQDEMVYINTDRINPAADITEEEALEQAVEIGLAFFDALGVEVVRTPSHVERPYDYDSYIECRSEILAHQFSDTSVLMDAAKAQWKRTHKYETREAEYTLVNFDVMVNGMRIWNQPSYPAGYTDELDAWIGFGVSASVLVSDSGVLVEARANHIPEIKGKRLPEMGELERFAEHLYGYRTLPLVMADTWQEALMLVLSDASSVGGIGPNTEERPYQNQHMDEPITAYGSRTVITEIYPCLSAISENELTMFWYIGSKQQYADGCRY